jgi:hypothetical protein
LLRQKNRGTCAFTKVPRFYNPAIDYRFILPVQGPELLLPEPQVLRGLLLPEPQALRALQSQEPVRVLPSCCNLLPQETEMPRKAR